MITKSLVPLSLILVAFSGLHLTCFKQADTKPKTIKQSEQNLKASAISTIQPNYPPLARAAKVGGDVVVEIVIDEQGSVASSMAVSGHALLKDSAETAARRWKFTPLKIDGNAAKVTGVITFKFDPDADPSNYNTEYKSEPPTPLPPLTEAEKEKWRLAEEAADLFIQRWQETLDLNVIFDEMYVSDPEQRRRNAYLFYSVYQFVTATAEGPEFNKNIDEQTLREAFFGFWNWYYMSGEYNLAFGKEGDRELRYPPGAAEFSRKVRSIKLNSNKMIPAQIKEFTTHYNQISALYRKHLSREVFASDLYKTNTRAQEAGREEDERPFKIMDGFSKYEIKKGVEVYRIERGVFTFFFIEENGKLKVLTLGFEL